MIYISQPRSWRNIVQQCTAIIITFTMLTVIIHSSESKRSATPSCGTLSSSFSTFLITWWLRSIGFPFIFAALIENSGFRWFSSVSENRCHVSRIRYSVLNRFRNAKSCRCCRYISAIFFQLVLIFRSFLGHFLLLIFCCKICLCAI